MAIKKYGRENFTKEVLHIFDSETKMNKKEREIVTKDFTKQSSNYNLRVGGDVSCRNGGVRGVHLTEEHKKKISSSRRDLKLTAWNKGVPTSLELIKKRMQTRRLTNYRPELNLKKFFGDSNPMRNSEVLSKYKTKIKGRKRKNNSDGTWNWYYPKKEEARKAPSPALLLPSAQTPY